jgi:hypothetical protein
MIFYMGTYLCTYSPCVPPHVAGVHTGHRQATMYGYQGMHMQAA